MMNTGDSAPVRPSSSSRASACGSSATMPAKMISEMPLPMPRAVICSPSHIRNIVPPTRVTTQDEAEEHAGIDHRRAEAAAHALQPDGDAVGLERRAAPSGSGCTG